MENMRSKGMLMIVFGASLWGASGTAIQYLFEQKHLTPQWLLMARMMIAGVFMLLYAKIAKQDIWAIWYHKIYRYKIIFYAIIGMFMTQYSFFMAIKYGNAATATVLQYLMPVFVLFYSLLVTKRWPGKLETTSVFLAMLGTYMLVTKGNWETLEISERTLFWGILAAFFCRLLYDLSRTNVENIPFRSCNWLEYVYWWYFYKYFFTTLVFHRCYGCGDYCGHDSTYSIGNGNSFLLLFRKYKIY